ncbi:MAG: DNA/RNA non-specific endonuclease [Hydrogenophilus thermoluteolus]
MRRGKTTTRTVRWPRRMVTLIAAVLLALAAWFVPDARLPADDPYGWPHGGSWFATTLVNPGFVVRYSEWHGVPEWVAYRADPPPRYRLGPRPDRFSPDSRTWRCRLHLGCVTHESYSRSGFDRGHMAPNFLIGTRYGRDAQHATFRMSNIAPQKPEHNRGSWERLERLEANRFAPGASKLWVIVGPMWGENPPRFSSAWVAVPNAYYRILLREETDGSRRAIAFLVPQDAPADSDLRDFIVAIDRIEALTGLDFFPALPENEQARLESVEADPIQWGLDDAWARQPARYFGGDRASP